MPSLIRIALVLSAAFLPLQAQAPALRLATPTASLPEPFTRIAAVVELDGSRVLIADDAEHRLVLADLAAGSIRGIGRRGAGPGEFRAMGALLPRPGGAYLVDFALRRLLPIRGDGTFENTIAFPGSIMARGADAAGNIYGEAFLPRPAVGVLPDSMWILRWNPATPRIDTVMKYDAFVSASVGGGRGGVMRIFHPIDTWLPLPGGEILLIEARTYRVTVLRDAKPVRSGTIPWTPLRVTDAEKDARREAQSRQRTQVVGQPGASPSAPRDIEIEFPATYPPFGGGGLGGRYTHVSPTGIVWVERMQATNDSIPRYDVIDSRDGRLVARVVLPARARVIGLGRGAVYTAERDADDVQYLRRYADPVPPS